MYNVHFSDNLISCYFLVIVCVVRNPAFLEWGFLLPFNYNKLWSKKSYTYHLSD